MMCPVAFADGQLFVSRGSGTKQFSPAVGRIRLYANSGHAEINREIETPFSC